MQMEQGLVVLGVQGNEYRIDSIRRNVYWSIYCNSGAECGYD